MARKPIRKITKFSQEDVIPAFRTDFWLHSPSKKIRNLTSSFLAEVKKEIKELRSACHHKKAKGNALYCKLCGFLFEVEG